MVFVTLLVQCVVEFANIPFAPIHEMQGLGKVGFVIKDVAKVAAVFVIVEVPSIVLINE